MCAILERSVVRSWVIPSAKYCCCRSSLRLAKGSTTIDRRGATRGCEIALAAAIVGVLEGVTGQTHQAIAAIATAIAPAAAMVTAVMRGRCGTELETLVAGSSATASGRNA